MSSVLRGAETRASARTYLPVMMTASAIYTQMQQAMAAQPQPGAVRFVQHMEPHGIVVRITKDRFGNSDVHLVASTAALPQAVFDVTEDDAKGMERTTDEQTGATYPDQRLFWSATWPMLHAIGLRPPSPTSPLPSPSVDPRADVVAYTDRFYDVSLDGETQLDGVPVYHLALRSRGTKDAHPLTDLYVDERTFLIREAVMAFRNEEIIGGDSGTFAFDFDRVGPYWLITRGRLEAREHYFAAHASGYALFTNAFELASPVP